MRRYLIWTLVAAAFLLYLFGSQIIGLLTDLLWFSELGYRPVMLTILRTQVALAGSLGIVFFVIVYVNLWIARRWTPPVPRLYNEIGLGERIGQIARRSIDLLLLAGSLVAALIVALEASSHWQQFLLWGHSVPFHVTDPLFNRDISFYIFRLPFILYLYRWLFFSIVVAFLATAWVHYTDRALQFTANMPVPRYAPHVKVHLSILLALLLFILAFGYWLRQYGLLQSQFGNLNLNGAGYTDVHSRLFALKLMSAGCAVVGILLLVNIGLRGLTAPAVGLVALILISLVAGVAYPWIMQSYIVAPSDVQLELPYIRNNIDATRRAYALDRIVTKPYKTDTPLTAKDLDIHQPTLENIRLWNYRMLGRVYNQQQGLKPYYTFFPEGPNASPGIDVDRYSFSSGYRQVMLAPREFDLDQAPQKTWVSQRLQYTHGYGVVMSSVNGVSSEGSPEYLLKDMPPQPIPALARDLRIGHPQIYFGMRDNGFAIVDSDQDEFDYPSGDEDKRTRYAGTAGIPIGSYGHKLLFGLLFGDSNFVLTKLIGPSSKVLIHRQIQDRIRTLAPFLFQDDDPYLVIADGHLVWMVDCYTATDLYPYSQPTGQFGEGNNYWRNAVKATVDAYDGTTRFYIFDRSDPIIQAYAGIFPELFLPAEKLPRSLMAHIRYPEGLFDIQSRLYRLYHMRDPRVFYTQSDAWDLATEGSSQTEEPPPMEPYYVSMVLPDSSRLEFILIRPFTPLGKQNMSAWMAVRCDPSDYGRAIVYTFPKTSLTQGPAQIEARIQQTPEISQRVTLWNQLGSRVNWGNLLVIPIGHSLLYVQSLYLESAQGTAKMPELKQVIAATDNPQRVVMAPTLEEALAQVLGVPVGAVAPAAAPGPRLARPPFAGAAPPAAAPPAGAPVGTAALVRQANQQLQAAESAQRAGDWAGYGRALGQLRQTLRTLQSRAGTAPARPTGPAPPARPAP